jgi:ribosome-associated protein YbcJ (S4-like RNA binding protein)
MSDKKTPTGQMQSGEKGKVQTATSETQANGKVRKERKKLVRPLDAQGNEIPETPEERFERLIKFRLPRLIKLFKHVGNLASGGQYKHTPDQAKVIVARAERATAELREKFLGTVETKDFWTL